MHKSVVTGFKKTVHPEWWTLLSGPMRTNFRNCLNNFITLVPESICPEPNQVFDAFVMPPATIKVVLIGFEPCSVRRESTGLSYSNQKMSPCMVNIGAAIAATCGQQIAGSDLSPWVSQGVLLLNMRLTSTVSCRNNNCNSFWEPLTREIIQWIDINIRNVVFVVWGSIINDVRPLIANSIVKTYTHPTPVCDNRLAPANKFVNCTHFLDINKLLRDSNRDVIEWGSPIVAAPDAGPVAAPPASVVAAAVATTAGGSVLPISFYNIADHVIFTDGGCENNGKVGARASYAAYFARGPMAARLLIGFVADIPGRAPTNNRAELLAMIEALTAIDTTSISKNIYIITDSKICMGTVNEWLDRWDREGIIDKRCNPDYTRLLLFQQKRLRGAGFSIMAIYQPAHINKSVAPNPTTDPELYFRYCGNTFVDACCTATLKNTPCPLPPPTLTA